MCMPGAICSRPYAKLLRNVHSDYYLSHRPL